MSLTAYPTLRLKLTMPQALKLQFLPAIPGSNAAAAADRAEQAAQDAQNAANTATAATANKVDKSGDVMTGFLTLNADPAANLQAATKQYVDTRTGGISDAPSDGTTYGRKNAAWAAAQPLDADLTSIAGATGSGTTGVHYRKAADNWVTLNIGTGLSLNTGTDTLTATASGVSDGDKTDITVSGGGTIWTIDAQAVTYAKIQNVTSARIHGRITAGAGSTEELTGTQVTTLLDPFTNTLKGVAPASGGGTANFLRADGTWATPATGGAPTTAEYITSSTDATLSNERVLTNTATVIWDFSTPGQAKATATGASGGTLPPDGTYTDIAVSGTGTIWTIRPAVVTYSKIQNISATNRFLGRITAGAGSTEELTGANAKTILGSGDLTKADDTNVTLTLGGTPTAALYSAVSLTLGWTGTLSVARGGLGVGTITGLMQGNGTGAVTGVANSSTVGQVLRVTGATTYGWGALDLTSANAVSGDLPLSSLAQGSARSLLGVTGNATADYAPIQGTADQVPVINGAGTALTFGTIATGGITNKAVTYAKIQDVSATSRFLGRITALAGIMEELTGTQATTLLDVFTSALKGLVPASGGGTTTFLRADGSFATPTGGSSVTINVQTILSSGTYTPTAGMKYCTIECLGGGGGGGGTGAGGASTMQGTGGGGSGGYSRKTASAATIGASQSVTIGTAGTAGTSGGGNGGAGGQTYVGGTFGTAICSANGGGGGGGATAALYGGGLGANVAGVAGDIMAAGAAGQSGIFQADASSSVCGGSGGAGAFGGGGQGAPFGGTSASGQAGQNYGAGGGGSMINGTTGGAKAGGAGSAGVIIITEYI